MVLWWDMIIKFQPQLEIFLLIIEIICPNVAAYFVTAAFNFDFGNTQIDAKYDWR